MIEKIYDEIRKNLKNPLLYAVALILCLFIFVLFPYIDANVLYYKRVNSRIEILKKVSEIDTDRFKNEKILVDEYNRILGEIDNQSENAMNQIFIQESDSTINNIKFLSGGILFWIVAVWCIAMKKMGIGERILGFFMFSILGVIFGMLAKAIPNIFNPWVNWIGFPLIVLLVIILFAINGNKKSSASTDEK